MAVTLQAMEAAERGVEESVLRASSLSKHFGQTRAVDGIDFDVAKGSVYAFLGPNGAGKSTTVKMMEGLLARDGGEVRVLGLDPWKQHEELKRKIGVMPQEFDFYEHLTPLEALEFYKELFASPANPAELLKQVILEDSANVQFGNLSGGQKQKLGLALAMVNLPELLFLDEPTTGLDPSARRAIWSIIRRFREEGKTIILTTHYLEEAEQLADHVAIINKGRIIASGTVGEIIEEFGSGRKLVVRAGRKMAEYLREMDIPLQENGGSLEIRLDGKLDLLKTMSLIEKSGLGYTHLTVGFDSLEDVFVKMVGEMSEGNLR